MTERRPELTGIPFGKYQLVKRLARGGMAEVFLARQSGPEGFQRMVAVKRILPHLVDSQDFVRMFLDEARLAAQLSHPNIVHIYDFGKVDEHYFIAMEYVDGVHAGDLIKHAETERMPDVLVARIGADACAGLHYAHELRDADGRQLHVVHRDVSPPNLIASYDGSIKLCDFGIAKAVGSIEQTRPGVVKGKFAYMSPEQTIGQKLDGRSDVFSLAVVLWELLAGRVLVPRHDPVDGMRMIRDGRIPPIEEERPDIAPTLAAAMGRALRTRREERCTGLELGRALEEFIKSSSDGIGSTLEIADWVRERFPRDGSGNHSALAIPPAGTRQTTGATHTALPLSEASVSVPMIAALPAASRSGSHGALERPVSELTSAGLFTLPGAEPEDPTLWDSAAGTSHALRPDRARRQHRRRASARLRVELGHRGSRVAGRGGRERARLRHAGRVARLRHRRGRPGRDRGDERLQAAATGPAAAGRPRRPQQQADGRGGARRRAAGDDAADGLPAPRAQGGSHRPDRRRRGGHRRGRHRAVEPVSSQPGIG